MQLTIESASLCEGTYDTLYFTLLHVSSVSLKGDCKIIKVAKANIWNNINKGYNPDMLS